MRPYAITRAQPVISWLPITATAVILRRPEAQITHDSVKLWQRRKAAWNIHMHMQYMHIRYMHIHTIIAWLLYLGRQVSAVATPGRVELQQPDIALGRACREAALGDLLHIGVAVVQACAAAMLPAPRSTPRPPASLQRMHSGQWSAHTLGI